MGFVARDLLQRSIETGTRERPVLLLQVKVEPIE